MVSYAGAHGNHIISHDQTRRECAKLSATMNFLSLPVNKIPLPHLSLSLSLSLSLFRTYVYAIRVHRELEGTRIELLLLHNEVKMKQIS